MIASVSRPSSMAIDHGVSGFSGAKMIDSHLARCSVDYVAG